MKQSCCEKGVDIIRSLAQRHRVNAMKGENQISMPIQKEKSQISYKVYSSVMNLYAVKLASVSSYYWTFIIIIFSTLISNSHEQKFFSSQNAEELENSEAVFKYGNNYGSSYTCVNIPSNFTLCKNIGYDKMIIPNLLQHDTLQEAEFHAKQWVPLLGIQCHPDTQLFLCSLFSPVCLDRLIYPCRSLCEGVRRGCEPRMLAYNYPWPKMLSCEKFPEDNDLCIYPGAANETQAIEDPECPACNHAHTCENIVDNYCRADFVLRAKLKQVGRGLQINFKKGRQFKPRTRKKKSKLYQHLYFDSIDHCCPGKLKPGTPYIVMGVQRDNKAYVTFIMEWNRSDRTLKSAVRTFRSMDCSNPLPMSIGANNNRNRTSSKIKRRRRRRRQRGSKQRGRKMRLSQGCPAT